MRRERTDSEAAEQRVAFFVFAGAVVGGAIAWLFGFALAKPLWAADVDTIALPLPMRAVFGVGVGAMTTRWLVVGVPSIGYLAALWALRKGFSHAFTAAIAASALTCVALLPMRPLASPDVAHFAADVRTLWLHGRYPTIRANVPEKVDDPVARQVIGYKDAPSGYGPLAYGVGGVALPFAGDSLTGNVLGQKAVSGAFLVLMALGTGLAAKKLGQNQGLAAGAVGLNPLLLFVFPGDGHNDSIMVAFAVFALPFLVDSSWTKRGEGIALGALSVLTKFSLAVAAPVFLAGWFPRLRPFLAGLVAFAGVLITVLILTGHGPRVSTLGPATNISPITPANVLADWFGPGDHGRRVIVGLGYSLFAVVLGGIIAWHPLEKSQDVVAAVALALFLFVFAASAGTLPWYESWYLPFAILSGRRWLITATLVFSIGMFGPLLARHWSQDLARAWNVSHPVDLFVLALWGATIAAASSIWYIDRRSPNKPRTRQTARAERRRQART
jgi:hypothetical protein